MTIYLTRSQADAYRAGKLKAALVRQRKSPPHPGEVLRFVAGSWGQGEALEGTHVIKSVYPITYDAGKWYRGILGTRWTLSSLDARQLAEECGFSSVAEMTERHGKDKELTRVSW